MPLQTNGAAVHRSLGRVLRSGARERILYQSVLKAGSPNDLQVRANDTRSWDLSGRKLNSVRRSSHTRRMVSGGRVKMVGGAMQRHMPGARGRNSRALDALGLPPDVSSACLGQFSTYTKLHMWTIWIKFSLGSGGQLEATLKKSWNTPK